jgi:hypothetical protein
MAIERRAFLRSAAVGTLALLALPALAQDAVVTLVADPTDPVANSEPRRWAAGELRSAMRARGLDVQQAASPKYMGEHMGLPYHQAAIRQKDMPPAGGAVRGAQFALSKRGLAVLHALQLRRLHAGRP